MGGATLPEPRAPGAGADGNAKPLTPSEPRAVAAAGVGDAQAIIRSVVGSAIGLATLVLMLAGLAIQQNANVNARIDDLSASVNARIDDVNARIDDVNARIDDLQEDVRELRALIIAAFERTDRPVRRPALP